VNNVAVASSLSGPARGAPIVLVAGMHRSGTSAVTSLLVGDRGWVGEPNDLLPPSRGNDIGFFERRDLVELHDSWLERLGGSWSEPPSHRALTQFRPEVAREASTYLEQLASQTPEGLTPALKDPRLCLFLDTWLAAAPDAVVIIPVRHPYEVAESLWRRDSVRHARTYALWEKHVLEVQEAVQHRPSVVVNFTELSATADPTLWVRALRAAGWGDGADANASATLRPHLLRATSSAHDRQIIEDRWLPASVAGLWQEFSSLPVVAMLGPGEPLSEDDLAARLAAVENESGDSGSG